MTRGERVLLFVFIATVLCAALVGVRHDPRRELFELTGIRAPERAQVEDEKRWFSFEPNLFLPDVLSANGCTYTARFAATRAEVDAIVKAGGLVALGVQPDVDRYLTGIDRTAPPEHIPSWAPPGHQTASVAAARIEADSDLALLYDGAFVHVLASRITHHPPQAQPEPMRRGPAP